MTGRGRRSGRRKADRKNEAENAVTYLSAVLETSLLEGIPNADNAARQILAIGKKHGVRPSSEVKRKICRRCKQSMFPSLTSRVRITSKTLISTCLRCGKKTRQGPDFARCSE